MQSEPSILVLLVEDSPTDVLLTREALSDAPRFRVAHVDRLGEALRRLDQDRFDVVLLDLGLPDSQGLETLFKVRHNSPESPVVVMTGRDDEDLALRAVHQGAQDYLVKNQVRGGNLARSILYAIERNRAEESLRRSEEKFRLLVEGIAGYSLIMLDPQGNVVEWNRGAERLKGYPADAIVGRHVSAFYTAEDQARDKPGALLRAAETRGYAKDEGWRVRSDGLTYWADVTITTLRDQSGNLRGFSEITHDMTERRRAEEQLRERTILASMTADVEQTLTRATSLSQMLQLCAEAAVRHLGAAFARLWTISESGDVLELQASAGLYTNFDDQFVRVAVGQFLSGKIARESKPYLTNDLSNDPQVSDPEWARREGLVAFAGYPLMLEDRLIGVMAMFARQSLSFHVLDALAAVSNSISLGIDRKRKEEALRVSEEQLRQMAENIDEMFWMTDADCSRLIYVSPAYEKITGRDRDPLFRNLHSLLDWVHPDDREKMASTLASMPRRLEIEYRILHGDGSTRWVRISSFPIVNDCGAVIRIVGTLQEITERKRLEDQFRQAQKMEAIGQLAGGIAHDFNNLLTIINGYGDIIRTSLPPEDPLREMVGEIVHAGERAASLTRQLLVFSRQQVLEPTVLVLNAIVANLEKLLRRLIGEDILLTTTLDSALGAIKADPGQVEQVIMNLVVNARDAMPRGGRLTIETANVELDETYTAAYPDLAPGPYVMLAVTDNGIGMDAATKARIFDPFFTTKGPGKGTGLGLATAYGIVRQSGGHISVYSETGSGSVFKVYLPRIFDRDAKLGKPEREEKVLRGSETILLVEDESSLRALAGHVLTMQGYEVLEASHGEEALRVAGEGSRAIHLLVTDVVMPEMSGRDLAERLTALRPGLKVLYLSGYTDDSVVRHGILQAEVAFLQKPFSPTALAQKVRAVLDGPR